MNNRYAIVLLFVSLLAGLLPAGAQHRKVLVIGIDGCRSDALQLANTPSLDAVMDSGLYTLNSWHVGLTWSGPSWSTILTGVQWPKHGVTDNSFSGSNFAAYPPFPTLAKEEIPGLKCVQVIEWAPLRDNITNAGWNRTVKVADGNSAATADSAIIQLADPDLDALFVYFDQVDLTGHAFTFDPQNQLYIDAIENVDAKIGSILAALYARPTYAQEDWLVLVITDHGGSSFSHGGNTPEERHIWWMAMGDAVEPQAIGGSDPGSYNCGNDEVFETSCVDIALLKSTPNQADIAVTALHHLIYDSGRNPETDTAWNLDGKSWLKKPVGIQNRHLTVFKSIYPNPSTGTFVLETHYDVANAAVSVFDMLGRGVPAIHTAHGSTISLDLSGNVNGTYVVKVKTTHGVATAKVVLGE